MRIKYNKMELTDLISPERIACNVEASSKKRALETLSELISTADGKFSSLDVFSSLLARERLGGTGVGHGVAIPHGRLKNSANKTIGALIKLKYGVDFDTLDDTPVDLLFALLVPENSTDEHLQILAVLASLFEQEDFREKLREADTSEKIYQLIKEWQ